jgi:hypothetical protein
MSDPNHGKGAVFKLFQEVARLPMAERKEALVPRLEHLWEMALARTYESKRGPVLNPDVATALRVVEVADALLCDVSESKGGKLAALKLFDGTKKAAG